MNISEPFIRRPIATALMTAGLVAFGAVSFFLLPVSALPTVDFPTISVSAELPGASPDVMTSTSGLGTTAIVLQFDLSRSIDGAAADVQTAINAASGLLPKGLPNPPTYRKTTIPTRWPREDSASRRSARR
jgi:multidrug efflux pump subunit AcrB